MYIHGASPASLSPSILLSSALSSTGTLTKRLNGGKHKLFKQTQFLNKFYLSCLEEVHLPADIKRNRFNIKLFHKTDQKEQTGIFTH